MNVDSQRRTTQIVAAYVRKNLIPTDQIAGLINSVHSTLSGLGNPPVVEEPPRVPAVSVRRSVRPDYIICIDCGYKGQMLKRHLQVRHGLSVAQYRMRWKLPSDYSTTAANYSEQRSQLAKSFGLGRAPKQPELPAAVPETASEKPARRRSASKTARTLTSAKKARPKINARKATAKKATAKKATAKKATAKKASPPARKPSSKRASKVATAPVGAPV
jgi:predicted transcriptional regulator